MKGQALPRTHLGVTLIELLFAIGLVALLAALATPGFRSGLRSAAVRTAAFELAVGLQRVRAGSIVEARPALLCPIDSSGNCVASGSDAAGWRAFIEDGAAPRDVGGQSLPAGVFLRATRSPIRFWPSSYAASAGTLTICDAQRVAQPRALVISAGGRARLEAADPDACES
jgi:type IV fimbrial biogenesis protein FimT